MTDFKRYWIIFIVGAVGYCLLEIIWRGRTHPSMAVVGGFCLIMIQRINILFKSSPYVLRAIMCAVAISLVELLAGLILNRALNLGVWDYSNRKFNFLGQICARYSMYWFFLSLGIIVLGNKIPFFR